MNQGLKILLDRIDTNPEEFDSFRSSRWDWHLDQLLSPSTRGSIITQQERDILVEKLTAVRGDAFTKAVLHTLCTGDTLTQRDLTRERAQLGAQLGLQGMGQSIRGPQLMPLAQMIVPTHN
jgi:hypothetical protein